MSHHFTNDKAVEKLGICKIKLLTLFARQVCNGMEANFQPGNFSHNQYLEKIPGAGDCDLGEFS
ncbi:MAG: hypothetical protein HWQ35_23920 [Nostoc sp. NMS1]|uniref:hypothetical protein n=1 Tax=unclassified Nostoc TaxID=2593658 RepID=UPI0025D4F0A4|nr:MULTISPECIES: hypothetical protein [unclassified Nostoc]MBN3909479.1 hypothetical protein [Nostoc sp. NMS1]MBN3994284.1 hypothetical protein [Nostoc sp. NMS2]